MGQDNRSRRQRALWLLAKVIIGAATVLWLNTLKEAYSGVSLVSPWLVVGGIIGLVGIIVLVTIIVLNWRDEQEFFTSRVVEV